MGASRSNLKQVAVAAGALLVTAVAGVSIYRTQFAAAQFNLPLHQGIAQVLAEETARLTTNRGQVVVIAIETGNQPELRAQLEEFERALRRFPHITIKETYKLETEGRAKYGLGSGLSARRFVRIVNKNLNAEAFVSFVGAPEMKDVNRQELKRTPLFVAETRSCDELKALFDAKILHAAVVPRFEFPAPVEDTPRTPRAWFDKQYQLVRSQDAARLPEGGRE